MLTVKKDPIDLKNGMLVKYEIKSEKEPYVGKGWVVGIASIGVPVLGRTVIIRDLSGNFPSDVYPFECFCCFEAWLEEIKPSSSEINGSWPNICT